MSAGAGKNWFASSARPPRPAALIVDQDESGRLSLCDRLAHSGWTIVEASGADILESSLRSRFDVVILNLSGLEADLQDIVRRLRRRRPAPEIILLTDRWHIALSIQGMQLGAFDDLLVPFDAERLLNRMVAALTHKRRGKTKIPRLGRSVIRSFIVSLGLEHTRYRYGEATASRPESRSQYDLKSREGA